MKLRDKVFDKNIVKKPWGYEYVIYRNKNKPVSIDDIKYKSVNDASKKLSIDRGTIRYRLKSEKYSTYVYI